MREGQPVPEHLLPQVLDMKAIKKEMAYLVSLAREAAAAAAAAAAEPEQGKGKGPGQGQKRPKVRSLGKARKRERAKQSPGKESPEAQASHLPQKGHLPRYKRNSWGKRCLEKARLPVQEHHHLIQTPLKPCPHKR